MEPDLVAQGDGFVIVDGSHQQSVVDLWCGVCGRWIEVRGVVGRLQFIATHGKCGRPACPCHAPLA